jgi:hypothetical protein
MKTPEQMAKQYVEQENLEYEEAAGGYYGFIAGYQAAMNSPEKQDTCEYILDMEKMVDVNPSSGWISVKERLPEYDVEVLTFETGNYKVNAVSEYTQWWWDSNEGFERNPTHWMPLPKPPEEK